MYNYKLKEQDNPAAKFQQERIDAFSEIENELQSLIKPLRQAKIETIKVYREQPNTYDVVKPTDLIGDFLKDIETLLEK